MKCKPLSCLLLFFLALAGPVLSQDLYCRVQVSHPQIQTSDNSIFQSLQQAITDFMNNRKWTSDVFAPQERIEANIIITVSEWDGNTRFKASAQIQSYRPVYGTSYNSLVFTVNDENWEFNYSEQKPLEYALTGQNENLSLLLAYYANIIAGIDYDTFSNQGGSRFFLRAQNIVNQAQNNGSTGWRSFENTRNRYWLAENLLNTELKPIRELMYIYHHQGLDTFFENMPQGRSTLLENLELLRQANQNRPSSMLLQLFFTAKSDEIANILKQAAPGERSKAINLLVEIDPSNAEKYRSANTEEAGSVFSGQ
ncbi:uncharacterized protein DUF4835 [Anseongella ginsenosidimutans]|uniref:Uncharacterized protein DUF4835 n=1 Tax=Anseongella ginsenosidimutans TaxID=496056 RepID=A0A4R3KMB9_9SPHI|nr:DUF4835 family protein [Anseongella ginsenosidimutans]QEC54015.1 DUF4835 family protein [Anseongella ginsenosidimutans]TCS85223.1 uncharacterized protein DUF4835 [Anseongella ginsenosidimutans]